MANVTLPDFYYYTAIPVEASTLVTVLEPTVTAIYSRPVETKVDGIEPTSVVVTNRS